MKNLPETGLVKDIDYDAKPDEENIVEGYMIHPTIPNKYLKGKFFKVIPTVWVFLDNADERSYVSASEALHPKYCRTRSSKIAYLDLILKCFRRLARIPTGKKLLSMLHWGLLMPQVYDEVFDVLNPRAFLRANNSKVLHFVNTIIMPPASLDNFVEITVDDSPVLSSNPAILYFVPDAVNVYKNERGKTYFLDPAIPLAHELIHCMHNTLGLYNYTDEIDVCSTFNGLMEKFTFGGEEIEKLPADVVNNYINLIKEKLQATCDFLNGSDCDKVGIFKNFITERYFMKKNAKITHKIKSLLTGKPTYSLKYNAHLELIKFACYEISHINIAKELSQPFPTKDDEVHLNTVVLEPKNYTARYGLANEIWSAKDYVTYGDPGENPLEGKIRAYYASPTNKKSGGFVNQGPTINFAEMMEKVQSTVSLEDLESVSHEDLCSEIDMDKLSKLMDQTK